MTNPRYEYLCEDKSVLYPHLKKYVWAPILPGLPAWLSPNTMTLLGNFFAWASFAVLLVLKPEDSTWFLVPALGNFLYLSLGNMDGMQARRSGRSSPLGEFLDHWFDAFNTGLLVFGFGVAMRTPPWFLVLMLSLVCVAYFSRVAEVPLPDLGASVEAVERGALAPERRALGMGFDRGQPSGGLEVQEGEEPDRAHAGSEVEHPAGAGSSAERRPRHQDVVGGVAVPAPELEDPPVAREAIERLAGGGGGPHASAP
jgi:hypothetical protein